MIEMEVNLGALDATIGRIVRAVGPSARHLLLSAAAEGVWTLCRSHLAALSNRRHRWARMLGAQETGHISKGARATTWHASSTSATVAIPIPGISRAWHDLDIRPVNAKKLTVPVNAVSYGHRVKELRGRGWRFFRAGDALFGYRGKGANRKTLPLYALKDHVPQLQDPELLPSKADISRTASKSAARYIQHLIGKADAA